MRPARRTGSCQTPVRKRTPPSTMAPKPAKKTSELASASATARWRITAGSMIGLGCRPERTTSATVERTDRENAPRIEMLVQPQSDPSTMAAARLATAMERKAAPSRSALWATGSLISRSTRAPTTRATRLRGRFTRKTQRQLTSTRRPPIGGPKAAAAPPTADHRPIAAPLRAGPKAGSRRPSDVGNMSAPPLAWRMRAATRRLSDGATAHRAEDAVKMPRPRRKAFFRPVRSAHLPGRDEQRREHDGVGAQHPRHGAQRLAVEALRDAREGDVHDEQVERRQEHAGQDDQCGQHRPRGRRLLGIATQRSQ